MDEKSPERFVSAKSSWALDELERSTRRRRLYQILAHQLGALLLSVLTLQPRLQLLEQRWGRNATKTSRHQSRGAILVALSDLFLSPLVGRLSDRFGRRPVMLVLPAVSLPLKLLAACFPTPQLLQLDRVVGDSLRTLCGTTMTMSCLADLYQGQQYAVALGYLQSATGAAIILAPQLASMLMGREGRFPRRCYIFAALLAVLHLALAWRGLEETNPKLAKEDASGPNRDPSGQSTPSVVAELSGVWGQDYKDWFAPVIHVSQLFSRGSALRQRAALFVLHCCVEGKVIQDQVNSVQSQLHWEAGSRSKWMSLHGAVLSAGSFCGDLVRRFGEHQFLVACHLASLGGFLWFKRQLLWLGLLPLLLGSSRRLVSSAWLLQEGCHAGLGRGEVVGLMATLRAASEAIFSFVSQKAFERAVKAQQPANVFLLPTALILLSEAVRTRIALRADVGRQLLGIGDSFWSVTLQREDSEVWGMELDLLDPALLQVCRLVPDGLVDRYNETVSEEKQIQAGDFILQVNRSTGEASAMADQLGGSKVRLTLQRPLWHRVPLTGLGKEQELRSVLTSLPQSVSLYATKSISGVPGIRRHDRIMAVDGSTGNLQNALGVRIDTIDIK